MLVYSNSEGERDLFILESCHTLIPGVYLTSSTYETNTMRHTLMHHSPAPRNSLDKTAALSRDIREQRSVIWSLSASFTSNIAFLSLLSFVGRHFLGTGLLEHIS